MDVDIKQMSNAEIKLYLKKMEDELRDAQDGLQVIGRCSLDSLEHDDDFVINDIIQLNRITQITQFE